MWNLVDPGVRKMVKRGCTFWAQWLHKLENLGPQPVPFRVHFDTQKPPGPDNSLWHKISAVTWVLLTNGREFSLTTNNIDQYVMTGRETSFKSIILQVSSKWTETLWIIFHSQKEEHELNEVSKDKYLTNSLRLPTTLLIYSLVISNN